MKEETPKVKYKIRHITDYTHKGEAKLDNASHEYVAAVETLQEINSIIKEEVDKGWIMLLRRKVGDWGHELFFENAKEVERKKNILEQQKKLRR